MESIIFLPEQNISRHTTKKHTNEELVSNHGEIMASRENKKNTCKIETLQLTQMQEMVITETQRLQRCHTEMDLIQEYTKCIQAETERLYPEREKRRDWLMITNLEKKGEEQKSRDENHIRNFIDKNHDEETKLVNRSGRFLSQKNQFAIDKELLVIKLTTLYEGETRNEHDVLTWNEKEKLLRELLTEEKINNQDLLNTIQNLWVKEERYESEIKVLQRENDSFKKNCKNFDIISKRNASIWQKKEKTLLGIIETEKSNYLITLDDLKKMQLKAKGYRIYMRRKQMVLDENVFLIKDKRHHLKDEMDQKTTAFDKTKRTIKYKMYDKQTMTNSDDSFTYELNREIRYVKEKFEIEMKVLKRENDALRKNCKNFDIISKHNEQAWLQKKKTLLDAIESEQKSCQIALDGLEILQSKEKGHEKDLDRKRKVMDENFFLAKENQHLQEKLNQKSAEYKQMNATLEEKITDLQNMKYINEHSTDELNTEIRTLKESLLEKETRFSTLQETYKIMMERLRKADNMVLEKVEENRVLKDKENIMGRRKKNSISQRTIETQTSCKPRKERSDSKFRFGLHRDTFRVKMLKSETKRQRNSITDQEDRIKILQSVLEKTEKRAIATENDLKHTQNDIGYYERSQKRLETECDDIKKSLEHEQEKVKQLESSINSTKQLKDDYMKLCSTIDSIKKETQDSEKRLKGNSGFQTQELILMNRLKEHIERIPVHRNYEFNASTCSSQKTINSYNIQDSDVYISENSVIRKGSTTDQ